MVRKKVIDPSEMTDLEKRFCEEYIIDLSPKNAALRAGYAWGTATKSASRIRDRLQPYIDELMARRQMRTEVQQDWVIREAMEVEKKCTRGEVVRNRRGEPLLVPVTDEDGNVTELRAQYQFDSRGAVAALELLAKHLGMDKQKIEITGDTDVSAALKKGRERALERLRKARNNEQDRK